MTMGEGDRVNDSNFTPERVMVLLKANLDVDLFFLFLKFLFFHKHCNKKEEKTSFPKTSPSKNTLL